MVFDHREEIWVDRIADAQILHVLNKRESSHVVQDAEYFWLPVAT